MLIHCWTTRKKVQMSPLSCILRHWRIGSNLAHQDFELQLWMAKMKLTTKALSFESLRTLDQLCEIKVQMEYVLNATKHISADNS